MDGFTYMSMISRIEHYEQTARRAAKEASLRRAAKKQEPAPVAVEMIQEPRKPMRVREIRIA